MPSKRVTPLWAVVGALTVGMFCLVSGILNVLEQRKPELDEFGMGAVPGSNWAFLWIGIAAAVLGGGVVLTVKRVWPRK